MLHTYVSAYCYYVCVLILLRTTTCVCVLILLHTCCQPASTGFSLGKTAYIRTQQHMRFLFFYFFKKKPVKYLLPASIEGVLCRRHTLQRRNVVVWHLREELTDPTLKRVQVLAAQHRHLPRSASGVSICTFMLVKQVLF